MYYPRRNYIGGSGYPVRAQVHIWGLLGVQKCSDYSAWHMMPGSFDACALGPWSAPKGEDQASSSLRRVSKQL